MIVLKKTPMIFPKPCRYFEQKMCFLIPKTADTQEFNHQAISTLEICDFPKKLPYFQKRGKKISIFFTIYCLLTGLLMKFWNILCRKASEL